MIQGFRMNQYSHLFEYNREWIKGWGWERGRFKKKRILPHARRVWGKGKEWAVGDGGRRKELTACD